MKQKYYRKEDYDLVMRLRKEGLSANKIIEVCKQEYGVELNRGIEHWIYGGVKPRVLRYPLKEGYENLTLSKAYILGVLCGDGCVTIKKPRVVLGVTSKEFVKKFVDAFNKHYGLTPSVTNIPKEKIKDSHVENPDHTIKAKQDQVRVTFYGRNLVLDIKRYGDFKTDTWRVPKEIRNSDNREIICSFLQGLYDSEGSASSHITLSSNSLNGLRDTQKLLEELGIRSSIWKGKTCFILAIHNQKTKRLFREQIGFRIAHRQKQLEQNLARYKTSKSYSQKRVNALVPQILKLRKRGFSSREITRELSIGKSTVLRKLHKYRQI